MTFHASSMILLKTFDKTTMLYLNSAYEKLIDSQIFKIYVQKC